MDWSDIFIILILMTIIVSVPTAWEVVAIFRSADRVQASILKLHDLMNSRLSALLETTATASRLEGVEQERSEQRQREAERDVP